MGAIVSRYYCGVPPPNYDLLLTAATKGNLAVVQKCLRQGISANHGGEGTTLPLHAACENNYVDVVRALIHGGADVNLKNEFRRTPLHLAAKKGHYLVTKVLVESGADVNASNKEETTALLSAAGCGQVDVARLLLEHGADPNAVAKVEVRGKIAPLHRAAGKGHAKMAELLVQFGADVNKTVWHQWTPLHYAAHGGHVEVARILLEKGADPKAKEKKGQTPMEMAVNRNNGCASVIGEYLIGKPEPSSVLGSARKPADPPVNYAEEPAASSSGLEGMLQQHNRWHSRTATGKARSIPVDGSSIGGGVFVVQQVHPPSRDYKLSALLADSENDSSLWFGKLYIDDDLYAKEKAFYSRWRAMSSVDTRMSVRTKMGESFPVLKEWFNKGEGDGAWLVIERGTNNLEAVVKRWNETRSIDKHERTRHLITIFEGVVKAVEMLHSHNWVHCDLKPSVMMWFEDSLCWKLVDFSTACRIGDESPLRYTLRYAAPEVVEAHGKGREMVSALSSMDMFSLGIVMLQMFSMMDPLGALPEKTWLQMLMNERPFPWEEDAGFLAQRVPQHVADSIQPLLSRSPSQRLTAQALLASSMFAAQSYSRDGLSQNNSPSLGPVGTSKECTPDTTPSSLGPTMMSSGGLRTGGLHTGPDPAHRHTNGAVPSRSPPDTHPPTAGPSSIRNSSHPLLQNALSLAASTQLPSPATSTLPAVPVIVSDSTLDANPPPDGWPRVPEGSWSIPSAGLNKDAARSTPFEAAGPAPSVDTVGSGQQEANGGGLGQNGGAPAPTDSSGRGNDTAVHTFPQGKTLKEKSSSTESGGDDVLRRAVTH